MTKKQELLLLVGVPGSGKSTLAKQLTGFVSLSQDLLGSRADVIFAMKKNLNEGKNVIIDRTNISRSQRNFFISEVKDYNVNITAVFLDFNMVDCINRIKERTEHETLPSSVGEEKIVEVVKKFQSSLEVPSYVEGINQIYTINDISNMQSFIDTLKKRFCT